jgi:multidrug resistance efflux pump
MSTKSRSASRALPSELAVSAQSDEWSRRTHHAPRRLIHLLIVLAALAACVYVAAVQINNRLVTNDRVKLDEVTVTANPVTLSSAASGRVTEMKAVEGVAVKAGDVLAVIEVLPKGDSTGNLEIVAPADGIVQNVAVPTGGTVASGVEIITMYEPGKLFFEAPLGYKAASKIRVGSTANFKVTGYGKVDATVAGVRSDFTTQRNGPNERTARLVLVPVDAAQLAPVVPGLTAKGYVDTDSVDSSQPRAVLNPRF